MRGWLKLSVSKMKVIRPNPVNTSNGERITNSDGPPPPSHSILPTLRT